MTWAKSLSSGIISLAMIVLFASQLDAAIFRYRLNGDWLTVTDGSTEGWGLNPNNDGSSGSGLPGSSDDARINWGNNTVSVTTTVPTVNRVQIGVDESGTVEVNNGGVLTSTQDILAGNNNANATGTLRVNEGGVVNIGRIFWAANNNADGVIEINSGGEVNVASHLWWGVTGDATIDISGTLNQTGGILGLGTSNAETPSNGTATVNILDGGKLNLFNISGALGQPSIQPGSFIDIMGTGELTVPGDKVGSLNGYVNANLIGGNGVPGPANLTVDLLKNPGFTTVYVTPTRIPEPHSFLLLGLAMGVGLCLKSRLIG